MEQSYTVSEIDRMREAVEVLANGISPAGYFWNFVTPEQVENRLRTYLTAGVDPAEMQELRDQKIAEMERVRAKYAATHNAANQAVSSTAGLPIPIEVTSAPKRHWYAFWA